MSYNKKQYNKRILSILNVYYANKDEDTPDTFIVKKIFPKHNIFMSYRTWLNIKRMKPSQLNQGS